MEIETKRRLTCSIREKKTVKISRARHEERGHGKLDTHGTLMARGTAESGS